MSLHLVASPPERVLSTRQSPALGLVRPPSVPSLGKGRAKLLCTPRSIFVAVSRGWGDCYSANGQRGRQTQVGVLGFADSCVTPGPPGGQRQSLAWEWTSC